MKRLAFIVSAFLSVLTLAVSGSPVAALTAQERWHYANLDIDFIDDPCTQPAAVQNGNIDAPKGSWDSSKDGVNPPYILEQFAIELLRDIALKRGVDPSNTVTQDHVIALVTFAYGEGGGITNDDFWNPFNTGYNDPDLLATAHSTSGVQAFKSFDAGVEANARVMAGAPDSHFQTRLGNVLTDPNSNVAAFFHTLTYFQETTGNAEWATASLQNPAQYYNNYITLAKDITSHWDTKASLVMRGAPGDPKNKTDASKLTYHPNGSGGTPSQNTNGTNDTNATCCDIGTTNGTYTIVLDPGHISDLHSVTDDTGLIDQDYPNHPELEDVWAVSQTVRNKLIADGYTVIMTKQDMSGRLDQTYVTLHERAQIAIDNHAALAVSIHDDAAQPFDTANNIVYAQAAGQYRQTPAGKKVNIYAGPTAIAASQKAAQAMVAARQTDEGHSVRFTTDATNDIGTRLPSPGSIWMVQLFSTVPWIYNEAGGHSAGMSGLSDADKQKYAKGLIDGIEAAVPRRQGDNGAASTTQTSDCAQNNGNAQGISAQAERLAWPQGGHGPFKSDATALYQQVEPSKGGAGFASDAADDLPFSDCGVFVATTMRSSGADPNYPRRGTDVQLNYLLSHPQKYQRVHGKNTTDPQNASDNMEAGDIMVTTSGVGHTYLFTGKWGDKNAYNSASASWHGHVPQATNFEQDSGGQHFAVFKMIQ